MEKSMVDVSIVIPVYNAENSVEELYSRIVTVFEKDIKKKFEIIFVDDASQDSSWEKLKELNKQDKRVKIIRLLSNYGQHNATSCGMKYTAGDYIITMDDDLQHIPEEIPGLLEYFLSNPENDVLMTVPQKRKHSLIRNIGSYLTNIIISISIKKPLKLRVSSFRIMSRIVKDAILNYKGKNVTISSIICYSTKRVGNYEVKHGERQYGRTNYSLIRLIKLSLSNAFNFSALPLKFISIIGFLVSFFAAIYVIYILYRKLTGGIHQPGFSSITILISFFSGTILFSIGVLGEYIIRILNNLNYEKNYLVREERIDE